jgi:hypothetical protein
MKLFLRGAMVLAAGLPFYAQARGVSPYLPLGLEPEMERQVERVLILADKPVLTRPIAAAVVLDALPKACQRDAELCDSVRQFLERYMRDEGITHASIEGAEASGAHRTAPNRYGMSENSAWDISGQAFWQGGDFFLASIGGVAYQHGSTPAGTYLSVGFDWAQLDVGYRAHWFSPMTDSAMLVSTQGPTFPSITLSNYRPLTRWGFTYELFAAELSTQPVKFHGAFTDAHPRLAGFHLGIEPVSGWSLSVNRLLEFGGAGRPESLHDIFTGFFRPGSTENLGPNVTEDQEFGNQAAAITSRFLFPGRTPFALYFEYSGEDTSRGGSYALGNAGLAAGIDFPQLWRRFDLTYEISEWQNGWYVHTIYQNGLTESEHVLGHWGGDDRRFRDGVGARAQMLRLGYAAPFGGRFELRGRLLDNAHYTAPGYDDTVYRREHELSLAYSRPWRAFTVGAEGTTGRDVFGQSFNRIAAFARYTGMTGNRLAEPSYSPPAADYPGGERFIVVGVSDYQIRINPETDVPETRSDWRFGPHFAIGARRAVSEHQDLGARIELDRFAGANMISLRALDYRYRIRRHLALDAFVGASTYRLGTPAIGVNFGLGVEWRDLLPGWDLSLDARAIRNAARDRLLASDPAGTRPDIFYTVPAATFSVVRRF